MTKLLEQAIEAARQLPPDRQNEVAEIILSASSVAPVIVSDDERDAILQGLEDARSGSFVPEEQVQALFSKHRTT